MTMDGDIPGSRRAIEGVTTKFAIYFFAVMSMLGAFSCISGLIRVCATDSKLLEEVSEPAAVFSIGMMTFAMFIPWFLITYFARHFLVTVKHLERENEELRARIAALSKDATE